jgi:hypothetical protein
MLILYLFCLLKNNNNNKSYLIYYKKRERKKKENLRLNTLILIDYMLNQSINVTSHFMSFANYTYDVTQLF